VTAGYRTDMKRDRWQYIAAGAAAGAALTALIARGTKTSGSTTANGSSSSERQASAISADQPKAGAASTTARCYNFDILKTIYQADRAHQASDLAVALALVGAGIAYISATLAFSDSIFSSTRFDRIQWAVLAIPLPAWMMAAYHSLLATSAPVRSRSIMAIENLLKIEAGFEEQECSFIGNEGAEKILNADEAKITHRIASYIAYGGVLPLIFAYTGYFLWRTPDIHDWQRWIGVATYGLFALFILGSWIAGYRSYKDAEKTLAPLRTQASRTPSTTASTPQAQCPSKVEDQP
jgi:hypothetical protein